MSEVLRMRLDDGSSVLVENTEPARSGIDRVGRVRDAVAEAGDTLQEAVLRLRPAVDAIVTGMRGLASSPDKVKVEFGIKLTAEAGVVVARASTEANFKVCVEWRAD
ncbi:MAG TPA: CU044_2847 family protein [Actinophytocola sp.]|uniref:CU044_2847 family protein n=1 Tax=Actinophytocola sp. TaxID=1872138 RepID=UPI002DDD2213|nr:CU044_2847 family protein [Actinophytocola sp.]HEV2780439.1 CU044_2847 family protein [Actinophytocola sp.]